MVHAPADVSLSAHSPMNESQPYVSTPKPRPRRLRYPGDVNSDTELTPKSSTKYIASLKKAVNQRSRKIKLTAQKVRRQHKRILSLKCLLQDLRKKNMISENAVELLQVYCCDYICTVFCLVDIKFGAMKVVVLFVSVF